MSDDEEYYEYEEDFMYEDLVPDMVDDLAASSYYEAALYEDPSIDVEEYFSDWDYYSDDYYDDDCTAEQSAERKKRTEIAARAKRRTKGSALKPTTTIPTKSPLYPDLTSFQGVVWKTPALDRDQDVAVLYEPHTGEKVALLENWREVFKFSQPALDKSRLKKRRVDELRTLDEADNEMSGEDEDEDEDAHDSLDEMSDGDSMDGDDSGSSVDTGDVSNTTPDAEPVSVRTKFASPPMVVIPFTRGRKRKVAQKDDLAEDTAPSAKRVESRKGGGSRGSSAAPVPVRRSARQKK